MPKMYRLYYWFRNTPFERPGGPWWYMDFDTLEDRARFYTDCIPFLYEFSSVDAKQYPHGWLPGHDAMNIKPPANALVQRVTETHISAVQTDVVHPNPKVEDARYVRENKG